MTMAENNIKVGDSVRVTGLSGMEAPRMIVTEVMAGPGICRCIWFDKNHVMHIEAFAIKLLARA
jgi:uncharacterized protein YodC (DUF2158 family)